MTTPVVTCDVSYYQVPVNNLYMREWLIFRCCDAGFHDPNCDANKAWASAAVASGRIRGWTAYGVFRPGQNAAMLEHAAMLPAGGHVMVDVESWGGKISGDHSAEINSLVASLRKLFPGQLLPGVDRVWAYGNRADLASIYPNRGNTQVVVASYGGSKPAVPNLIGWQYTDGTYMVPGLPSVSAPFGACDHNVLFLPLVTPPPEVPLSAAEVADIKAHVDQQIAQVRDDLTALLSKVMDTRSRSVDNANALARVEATTVATMNSAASANLALTDKQRGVVVALAALKQTLTGQIDLTAVTQAAHDGAAAGADLNGKTLTINTPGGTA